MALLYAEDFNTYGTGSAGTARMANGLWLNTAATNIVSDPDVTVSGNVFSFSSAEPRLALSSASFTVGVARRMYMAALPSLSSGVPIVVFRNISNANLCSVIVLPSGFIRVLNSAGSTLATSSGPIAIAGSWQHFEVKAFFSSTVGSVEVKLEGSTVLSVTSVNTSPSGLECAIISFSNGTADQFMKDLVIWNNIGSYVNDWVGTVSTVSVVPSADVALNWTPVGAANGWSILDNAPPNDANYIEAGTPAPAAYRASLTNLLANVTQVKGLYVLQRSRKANGDDGNIQVTLHSSAATQLGPNQAIGSSFTYYGFASEFDPNTTVAWTPAGVNALEVSLNRTV